MVLGKEKGGRSVIAIPSTTFSYNRKQVKLLTTCFRQNHFRFAPTIRYGMDIFKTKDPDQIYCIARLIDKIKSFVDGDKAALLLSDDRLVVTKGGEDVVINEGSDKIDYSLQNWVEEVL